MNAEEDTGGMAQFMLDVREQSQTLEGADNSDKKDEIMVEQTPSDDLPETGADFAAELA